MLHGIIFCNKYHIQPLPTTEELILCFSWPIPCSRLAVSHYQTLLGCYPFLPSPVQNAGSVEEHTTAHHPSSMTSKTKNMLTNAARTPAQGCPTHPSRPAPAQAGPLPIRKCPNPSHGLFRVPQVWREITYPSTKQFSPQ